MANNLTSQNTANNFTLQNTANSKTQLAVDNVTKIESDNHKDDQEILNRWRLVLGKYAADQISFSGAQGKKGESENRQQRAGQDYADSDAGEEIRYMDMEQALDFLYGREYDEAQDIRTDKQGGSGNAQLTVPYWLTKIKKLFPKRTVEIMERDALERYHMTELLTDPEVLRKLEPNKELLKTILNLKHMMKGEVLALAREIVRKVAEEITRKLEQQLQKSFFGKINRNTSSPVKSVRNLDMKKRFA